MARRRTIDEYSGRPLYRQLADILRDAINSDELAPGVTLPPERQIAYDYNLGVDAVRKALAILRGEGLIETERGKPSRVRARPEPTVVTVPPARQITARMPTEDERRRLDLPEGVPLLVIRSASGVELLPADRHTIETVPDSDANADS